MHDAHRHLTSEALADRLRRIVFEPRRWTKADKEALILEAARRLTLQSATDAATVQRTTDERNTP